jgi:aldose 1-epimerase
MSVYALDFGTTRKGLPTHLFRLKNENGMEVDVTDLGASVAAVRVPSKSGELVDVALGFDDVSRYENNVFAIGAIVGRCANRIAGAQFQLAGRTYQLTANEAPNTLHGGCDMWFERLWEGATIGKKGDRRRGANADTAIFGLLSPDGDQGFPGELDVRVTYQLTSDNELRITYDAQPGVETLVNLTNHTYWNLNGHASGSVLDHTLRIAAEQYTPAGASKIPDGRKVNVGGTPFDFRTPKVIGRDFTTSFSDYDHNFLLGSARHTRLVATLEGNETGIAMDVITDMPAMQVYTAREMESHAAKDGADYGAYAGIALETQYTPDAIHHPSFEQPIFTPDRPFHSVTTYLFRA